MEIKSAATGISDSFPSLNGIVALKHDSGGFATTSILPFFAHQTNQCIEIFRAIAHT
jgi:hypothetical protein